MGTWLGFTDAKWGAQAYGRAGQLRIPVRRRRGAAVAVQHAFLHRGGEHPQVRPRPVAGDPAEPEHPVQVLHRAAVLLPFIVPTALSAIAFWWIYDAQFSISAGCWSSWAGSTPTSISSANPGWPPSTIAANIWRGVPFVAICLLAGLQTHPALAVRGGLDRRRQNVAAVLVRNAAAAHADHRSGDDFSVLFTFTDFQLIYVLTRGGPLNSTHLMATLSFQRAISGGALGEGAALATAMIRSCWRRYCFLLWLAAPRLAARRYRQMSQDIRRRKA